MSNILRVHSFESLAALDGPGLRYAIFLAGCPLRCAYCHNPDTWDMSNSTEYTAEGLLERARRFKPYFKSSGGVTISGGEPLLQAESLTVLTKLLQNEGIHVAIDTAGSVMNGDVLKLLSLKPLLLLDIKMTDETRFKKYIGGSLSATLDFLNKAEEYGCEIWLRYVVVPTINDSDEDILFLRSLKAAHPAITNITLLPYHKMGIPKYKKLDIPYSLSDIAVPTDEHMSHLNELLKV